MNMQPYRQNPRDPRSQKHYHHLSTLQNARKRPSEHTVESQTQPRTAKTDPKAPSSLWASVSFIRTTTLPNEARKLHVAPCGVRDLRLAAEMVSSQIRDRQCSQNLVFEACKDWQLVEVTKKSHPFIFEGEHSLIMSKVPLTVVQCNMSNGKWTANQKTVIGYGFVTVKPFPMPINNFAFVESLIPFGQIKILYQMRNSPLKSLSLTTPNASRHRSETQAREWKLIKISGIPPTYHGVTSKALISFITQAGALDPRLPAIVKTSNHEL